jgi:CHASE3 domain sensor protein
MSFNDLNISKKFAVGFAVVVTIVTVMCVAVFLNLRSIRGAVGENDLEVAELNFAHDVQLQIIERQNGVRGFAITGDKSFLKAVDEAQAKAQADLSAWLKLAPEDAATVPPIKAEVESIFAEQDHQVAMAADPATHEAALVDLGRKGRLNKIRA